MSTEKWVWWWGIEGSNFISKEIEFTDFYKMQVHSDWHSKEYGKLFKGYWLRYEKI